MAAWSQSVLGIGEHLVHPLVLSTNGVPGFVFCAGEGDIIPTVKGCRDAQLSVWEHSGPQGYSELLSSLNPSDGQRR